MRYSPFPADQYAVTVYTPTGKPYRRGLGASPIFAGEEGYWNLFWLACPEVDALLSWPPEQHMQIPIYHPMMNTCKSSLLFPVGGRVLRHWLETEPAAKVVRRLEQADCEALPLRVQSPRRWLKELKTRAAQAQITENHGNIVYANFGRRAS